MDANTFGEAFNKGIFTGLYKAFEIMFLTPPTCYIMFGMIIFAIGLKILEIIIKKNKNNKK